MMEMETKSQKDIKQSKTFLWNFFSCSILLYFMILVVSTEY